MRTETDFDPHDPDLIARIRAEAATDNFFFFHELIETQMTHDTQRLRRRLLNIAQAAPGVSEGLIELVDKRLQDAYAGKPRKVTPEPEINHAYQVAIMFAHAVGLDRLTTTQYAIALAHDFKENTPFDPKEIGKIVGDNDVIVGINAMSHQINGEPIWPFAVNKTPYFMEVISAGRTHPHLEVPLLKVVDQNVVANSPLHRSQLRAQRLNRRWTQVTDRKQDQMESYLHLLSEFAPEQTRAVDLLCDGLVFLQLRQGQPFTDQIKPQRRNNGNGNALRRR